MKPPRGQHTYQHLEQIIRLCCIEWYLKVEINKMASSKRDSVASVKSSSMFHLDPSHRAGSMASVRRNSILALGGLGGSVLTLPGAVDLFDSDDVEHQVPDGGWGWMVVLGTTMLTTLTCGIQSSFGVVFGLPLTDMGASSTTVGWIFNLFCMMWNLGGLLVGPFTAEFGWRPTAFVAATIVAVSMVISGFATTPLFLFFSFAIVTGLGCGLCVAISLTFGAQYFLKYLGVANAFPMAGVCVGGMMLPQLVRILQNEYAYLGSMLVLGAIILNACAATLLFHPPEWHRKKVQSNQDNIETNMLSKHERKNSMKRNASDIKGSYSSLSPVKEESPIKENVKGDYHIVSQEDNSHTERHQAQKRSKKSAVKPEEDGNKVLKVIKSILSNLLILRSPQAVIIALGSMFFIMVLNFIIMMPFAFLAVGHTLEDGATAASVGAIANLIARLSISMMSDFSWFSKRLFYMGSLLVCSFGIAGFTFTESLLWQTVFTGIYGLGMGATFSLYSLTMIEYMGLENLGATYGAVSLTVSVGYVTIGPAIGFVRDYTGSFDIAMLMTAACPLVAFILWLFMPLAVRYDQKTEQKNKMLKTSASMSHFDGEARRTSIIY